jgi:hypothetical protein
MPVVRHGPGLSRQLCTAVNAGSANRRPASLGPPKAFPGLCAPVRSSYSSCLFIDSLPFAHHNLSHSGSSPSALSLLPAGLTGAPFGHWLRRGGAAVLLLEEGELAVAEGVALALILHGLLPVADEVLAEAEGACGPGDGVALLGDELDGLRLELEGVGASRPCHAGPPRVSLCP